MGKFSAYKLPLKSLSVGSHEFDYHLDKKFFEDMESADIHDADLNIHVTVVAKNDLYELTIDITGEITLLCDRCLDDLQWPVDTTYHIYVKYGADYNDDSDELLEIPESDNYLNIAYMIYDTVALTIPIKHVHPLGKCNRAMSSLLKKHRAPGNISEEDGEMMEEIIDDIENTDVADSDNEATTDPRWDELKKLNDNN
ncbi:MAG TPA: DUF177 domain-containing protein [Muribaculum sp.]|uniref:DUF177 domain-containing protein n=1 Tax=Heminiphilus faecis TaxID=2601703 RepID=A0ABV4CUV0_9BACT|nr:DUF177 domain-containing protein [Heminiphilus faecis]HRF69261.1 DUF177 domain-containing protein [Muribaculum sp.]